MTPPPPSLFKGSQDSRRRPQDSSCPTKFMWVLLWATFLSSATSFIRSLPQALCTCCSLCLDALSGSPRQVDPTYSPLLRPRGCSPSRPLAIGLARSFEHPLLVTTNYLRRHHCSVSVSVRGAARRKGQHLSCFDTAWVSLWGGWWHLEGKPQKQDGQWKERVTKGHIL